jgi:hypothetical protein
VLLCRPDSRGDAGRQDTISPDTGYGLAAIMN